MKKWQCDVCGFIYDPKKCDMMLIPLGTPFEDLPDDWVCPSCSSSKGAFRLID